MKRVMVDMSATLLHHGHIRLLKEASKIGDVVVALTTDDEIIEKKGYTPELEFSQRKEILESIKYVSEVVESPWMLDDEFLDKHRIELLVHGSDNSNEVREERLVIFERTNGISSSIIRGKVLLSIGERYCSKN